MTTDMHSPVKLISNLLSQLDCSDIHPSWLLCCSCSTKSIRINLFATNSTYPGNWLIYSPPIYFNENNIIQMPINNDCIYEKPPILQNLLHRYSLSFCYLMLPAFPEFPRDTLWGQGLNNLKAQFGEIYFY